MTRSNLNKVLGYSLDTIRIASLIFLFISTALFIGSFFVPSVIGAVILGVISFTGIAIGAIAFGAEELVRYNSTVRSFLLGLPVVKSVLSTIDRTFNPEHNPLAQTALEISQNVKEICEASAEKIIECFDYAFHADGIQEDLEEEQDRSTDFAKRTARKTPAQGFEVDQ